jgi:hypothetical protein
MTWRSFKERVRELINPLASDEHLVELMLQLQLMGEIVLVENTNYEDDLLCFSPEWLCGPEVLGRLFSHERFFNVKPSCLNGIYNTQDLREIFADLCPTGHNFDLLKDIFIAFELCAELDSASSHSDLVYEFTALNFLSEPLPVAFKLLKQPQSTNTNFVFSGFQLKSSSFHLDPTFDFVANLTNSNGIQNALINSSVSSFSQCTQFNPPPSLLNLNFETLSNGQLAYLFFRIQIHLRLLSTSFHVADLEDVINNNNNSAMNMNNYYSNKYNSLRNSSKQSSFDEFYSKAKSLTSLSSVNLKMQSPTNPNSGYQKMLSNQASLSKYFFGFFITQFMY